MYLICHRTEHIYKHHKPYQNLKLKIHGKHVDLGNHPHEDPHCRLCHQLHGNDGKRELQSHNYVALKQFHHHHVQLRPQLYFSKGHQPGGDKVHSD